MADGDARLQVVLEAKIDKLTEKLSAANRAVYGASAKFQKDLDAADRKFGGMFAKGNPGKALDNVFSRTRLAAIEAGSARLPIFGSALADLGLAGLTAAAGVAAVAAAFAGAREAARFADDIADAAKNAHVATDALQEYRYAVRAAGGEEKGADAALQAFSVTLGRAAEGRVKALRAFRELFGKGFTAADVKQLGDVDQALQAVTKRIEGLSDIDKATAVANFGLDGLKPLIEDGTAAMERLRAEAHRVGIVMDAELVKRGGELNDQFETVSRVIKVQWMSALVDVGPVLVGILQQMAYLAKLAADVADSFRSIENRRLSSLRAQRDFLVERQKDPFRRAIKGDQDKKTIASLDAEINKREIAGINEQLKAADQRPTHTLENVSPAGGGHAKAAPRDDTEERNQRINAALADATRELLQAQLGLTADIEARAVIERQIAEEEAKKTAASLERQKAELEADKGFTGDKERRQAELDLAIAAANMAATAKQQVLDRDLALALEDRQLDVYKLTIEAQISGLEAEAAIATTAAKRAEVEGRILALRQQLERDLTGTQLDRDVKLGNKSPEQRAAELAGQAATQAGQRSQFALDHQNPIEQFQRQVADFTTLVQGDAVSAMRSLADGLAEAIGNAHNLGDVASSVFRQLVAQLLSAAIQKDIASPILAAVFGMPGHAAGTSSSPGGWHKVGEQGIELVNMRPGAQVISSQQLRTAAGAPSAGGGFTVLAPFHFHAEGAVLTQEILQQANAHADRQAARAAQYGREAAGRDMRQAQYAGRLNA